MWCNMKGMQRDNLTKERQSRLATGGGPEIPEAEVDPDIALITPHLMATASTIFSSNMSNEALTEREFAILDETCTIDHLIEEGSTEIQLATELPSAGDSIQNKFVAVDEKPSTSQFPQRKRLRENIAITSRKKNNAVTDQENDEKTLKLEKIHRIMKQEEELGLLKKKHEEKKQDLEIQYLEKRCELMKKELELVDLKIINEKEKHKLELQYIKDKNSQNLS